MSFFLYLSALQWGVMGSMSFPAPFMTKFLPPQGQIHPCPGGFSAPWGTPLSIPNNLAAIDYKKRSTAWWF
jgi:hypothetical protein